MSDERDALLRMLKEGQRVVQSRTYSAATAAASLNAANTPSSSGSGTGGGGATGSSQEALVPADGGKSSRVVTATHLNAKDNLKEFLRHYYDMFRAFADNPERYEMRLGRELTSYDRHCLHDLAQACGLSHESRGQEPHRELLLRKDALFHGSAGQHKHVNLEAIADAITGKESKFDVGRHRSRKDKNAGEPRPGEIGSYADEDAVRKLARFENAKNEFRHATFMGYTHEEALAMEREGGRLEDILRGDAEDGGEGVGRPAPSVYAKAQQRLALQQRAGAKTANSAKDGHSGEEDRSEAPSPVPAVYYETCKGCGSRAQLEGDRGKWRCLHYCARCTKQTIWVLEEDTGLVLTPRHGASSPGGAAGELEKKAGGTGKLPAPSRQAAGKRRREDAEAYGSQRPLALDRSDEEAEGGEGRSSMSIDRSDSDAESSADADEDAEALTVDDVVDSAAINDFSDADTNWIRGFAHAHREHLTDHVIFCIEFADLTRARIFTAHDEQLMSAARRRRLAKRQREGGASSSGPCPCLYAVVRAIGTGPSDAQPYQPVTALVDKLLEAARGDKAEAKGTLVDVAVAFKNLSAYGTEATVVCQLRGGVDPASAGLVALQKELGSKHLFLTPVLSEAIVRTSQE